MNKLWRDFGHAFRFLRKNIGFTSAIVFLLSLGIGANAAIYSIVDVVLLQPLPGRDPGSLVRLYTSAEKRGTEQGAFSFPIFNEYREHLTSLTGISAYRQAKLEVSVGRGLGQRISGEIVSGNFFDTLGVTPLYGRLFSAADDAPKGGNFVAVLGEPYWKQEFDGRPDVIGSTLQVNGQSFTIVGVAPSSLQEFERGAQIWLPMSMAVQAEPMMATQIDRIANDFFRVVGRLRPGVQLQQAQAELDVVGQRFGAGQTLHLWEGMSESLVNPTTAPPDPSNWEQYDWKKPWATIASAQKGFTLEEGRLSWLLLGLAALVLIIATADVAGLLLVRAEHEEKEIAIRASLGASRWSLLRLQVARGLLLAALGSAGGLLTASWAAKLLFASAPEGLPLPVGIASSVLTFHVIAFVVGISFFAALGFSLLPALREKPYEISESLKRQTSGLRFGTNRSSRWQVVLVFSQIVASVVLLVGAGLLAETMRNIARIDLGFETDRVLSASLDLSRQNYSKAQGATILRPLLEKAQSIPGVSSAALVGGSPVTWKSGSYDAKQLSCHNLAATMVSPGYFRTLRIPLLRGRDFTFADDKNSAGVLIVNQAAANLCWAGRDPIGQGFPGMLTVAKPFQIVGVAGNVRMQDPDTKPLPRVYAPLAQFYEAFPWQFAFSILVRGNLPPHTLIPALNSSVRSLDANLSLYDVQTPRELLSRNFERQRFFSRILFAFATLALVLAIVGLYSLLAYVTARRTKEFGIRMALGALPSQVLRLVLGQGGVLVISGVIAGLLAAAGAARLLQSLLFGISPIDLRTFLAVGALFLAICAMACFVPARRAASVDPMLALRDE